MVKDYNIKINKINDQELMVSQHEELKDQKGLKSSKKEL